MSAIATINGLSVIDLRLCLPRTGVWHAETSVDAEEALAGRVQLELAGASFSGVVRSGGVSHGTALALIVGGAGGLPTALPAKAYRAVPLRVPLEDLLVAAGEALDSNSDQELLASQLPQWARMEGTCAQALWALVGASWRVLPSGRLWVGSSERWLPVELEYELLTDDPMRRSKVLAVENPSGLVPGSSLSGENVSYVEHTVFGATFRTRVWFE